MGATPFCEHTVLESDETRIVVEYDEVGHARLEVTASGYRGGSAEAGRLACAAIHEARLHHADRIDGALDASSPACGAILEALHGQIGDDLDSIVMRRAGSTVLVTLATHPVHASVPTAASVPVAVSVPTPAAAPAALLPLGAGRGHRGARTTVPALAR